MDTDTNQIQAKVEETQAPNIPLFQDKEVISKYVDFSSKYGIGYKLSNGSYGVLFNDSTKIILDANLFNFDYIQRAPTQQLLIDASKKVPITSDGEEVHSHTFFSYPTSLGKKVILLQHFKSFLDGNSKFKPITFPFTTQNAPQRTTPSPLPHLKKWKSSSKALLFRLTNKLIHTVFLDDRSELIIDSGAQGIVTYVNKGGEARSMPLHSDIEGKDASMFKRLQIAKEMLMQQSSGQGKAEQRNKANAKTVNNQ
ncbi:hypothetical protein FGO68_gene9289 [Halteria grandinella]|uniref:POLO box domain-containing protein n=1 Tax=Halteria grandinella TaxID=5974 RepID=A0A8J8NDJ7_HALGN|nr:hypothetical protein FGO68_gene9289 [Halteria grandinella]